jgi:hypothetical protein
MWEISSHPATPGVASNIKIVRRLFDEKKSSKGFK